MKSDIRVIFLFFFLTEAATSISGNSFLSGRHRVRTRFELVSLKSNTISFCGSQFTFHAKCCQTFYCTLDFYKFFSLTSEFHSPASCCWSSKMTFGLWLVFISQRGRWESCGRLHRPLTCEPAPVRCRQWDSLKTSGTPEPIWCSMMGFSDVIQVTGNFGQPHTPATSYMVELYFHSHPINEPIDLFSYHNKTMSLEKKPSIDPNRKRNRHFHSAFGRWLVWLDLTWPHPSFILLVAWYPWLIYCNRDLSPPQFSVAWVGKTWKANSERKHFSFPFRRQSSHIVSDVTSFF